MDIDPTTARGLYGNPDFHHGGRGGPRRKEGDDCLFSVRSAPTLALSVFNPDGAGEVATQRLSLGAHHALQTERHWQFHCYRPLA